MKITHRNKNRAFSLIELVIVIIIMGVISAIAIPRMMKGADNADVTGLQADLAVLRNAVELYRYEHGIFPTALNIADQLTLTTDGAGDTAGADYGPYVVKIPPLKTGLQKGEVTFAAPGAVPPVAAVPGNGWLYDEASGSVWANDIDHFDK